MKTTFKIGNKDVILDGNPDEIWQILLKLQNGQSINQINTKSDEIYSPTIIDIIKFIKDRDNFQHSMGHIQQHYFGRKLILDNPSDKKIYIKLNRMLKTARKKIKKVYSGEWVEDTLNTMTIGRAHFKTYKFVKN